MGSLDAAWLWWGGAARVPELHYSNLQGDKQSMGFLAQLGLCARLLIIPLVKIHFPCEEQNSSRVVPQRSQEAGIPVEISKMGVRQKRKGQLPDQEEDPKLIAQEILKFQV